MSTSALSPQDLQELRELASRWGKIVARRACGDAGPGLDLDLAAMEQIAEAAARGLSEGTLATLLGQQAQTLATDHPCPDGGRRCPVGRASRPLVCRAGPITCREPGCRCPAGRRDFFPLRPALRLDGHSYSPALLERILTVAGRLQSFEQAAIALGVAADVDISGRQINRLTQAVGADLARRRDLQAARYRRRELPARVAEPLPVAVVEVDGGRLGTRQAGAGPGVDASQRKTGSPA